ncbi:hypothetical protein F5B19DRAFT_487860 [Rostrohypoxylon terebratum]|nr:hypothetical protein F5B19DRAFT_487860 [Rostrohypoxylon terebratum]
MAQESKKTDGSRTPEKDSDAEESQPLMDRTKDKVQDIDTAKSIKGYIKSIIEDSRGRRASLSHILSGGGVSSRASSLSAKGKELWKKHAHSSMPEKPVARPPQKDPLHQWMVDHSGGTVQDKP